MSDCKETVKKDLSVRVHICPYCGYIENRDVNAAKNILARAPYPYKVNGVDRPPFPTPRSGERPHMCIPLQNLINRQPCRICTRDGTGFDE